MRIKDIVIETEQLNENIFHIIRNLFTRKKGVNWIKRGKDKIDGRRFIIDYYEQIDDYERVAADYRELIEMLDDPNLSKESKQAIYWMINIVGERRAALLLNRKGAQD